MNWLKEALAQNLLVRQENEGLFSGKLIHYRKEFYRYLWGGGRVAVYDITGKSIYKLVYNAIRFDHMGHYKN